MHKAKILFPLPIGICFVFFTVPETRGLTLTELTTLFGGKLNEDDAIIVGVDTPATPYETSSESTSLTSEESKETEKANNSQAIV